jgi:hypothetical protein
MLNLLAWAEKFVSTPSVSSDGNAQIAVRACELLGEIGIAARRETTHLDGTVYETVIADLGPRDHPDGLLLLTHLDTVPPGEPEAWTATGANPWRPTREGDRLYGLGSADAKVDMVCKAAGLAGVDRSRLRRPVRVVGTFGEEIGLLGVRWLIDNGLVEGFRYALVGEPSELVAIHAHKGRRVYEARIPLERLKNPAGSCRCSSPGPSLARCPQRLSPHHWSSSTPPGTGCWASSAIIAIRSSTPTTVWATSAARSFATTARYSSSICDRSPASTRTS